MAIDTFINVTIDKGATSIPDRQNHFHKVARGTANANDLTLAFDHTVVSSMSILLSALDQTVRALRGGAELTA